ncbi:hypothetical protein [Hirschia litorea]|uniref:Uncharacterized protein n=1 Tax=Hirschia litorea TaxID=1199156 RepID=A0ABW2IMF0_9PROT
MLTPLLAARTVSETFSRHGMDFDVSAASVAATRDTIDRRFESLMAGQESRKATWSRLVSEQVRGGYLKTARGLLLAAPSMLDAQNSAALLASVDVQGLAGDDAIEAAALNYLDEDVRYAYEHAVSPLRAMWRAAIAQPEAGASPEEAETSENLPPSAGLNVLGDERDLAMQAARWVRGQNIDTFAFALSGVGLSALGDSERAGASIVRAADKAGKLNPDLKRHIERRLFNVAPPERLKRDLTVRFSGALGIAAQGDVVLDIIRGDIDQRELADFEEQLRFIREISLKTSAPATIRILSYARNDLDLQRARLLTEAGGDKALALMAMEGATALTAAQTPVRWTTRLRVMLSFLVGMGLSLLWLTADTFIRSMRRGRSVRRSAVYGLDEREWDYDKRP